MFTSPNGYYHDSDGRDLYEPFHKLAKVQIQPPRNPNKPPTSFRIRDILGIDDSRNNHRHGNEGVAVVPRIVRPWDVSPCSGRDSENSSDLEDREINVEDDTPPKTDKHDKDVSPLDALMGMTNKIFEGLETTEAAVKYNKWTDRMYLYLEYAFSQWVTHSYTSI
ncbi:hypothetical protein ACJMK2_004951 [Sinanodonta woodiana]|uniref:Uncharacterized protein n=1 Tax=Sinanodonta woodiana TaxID=1069815 RepID=A0ABD3VNP5_SINWO